MPELPEVETIKSFLTSKLIGRKIVRIEILSKKQFIGNPEVILHKKIIEIKRFGKIITFYLEKNLYLNTHLKLTGELLFAKDKNNPVFKEIIPFTNTHRMPGKTTRIIIHFDDNSALFFNDLRKFGWMKIAPQPLIPKGIDVLSSNFTLSYMAKIIQSSNKPIKLLLMDQEKITGIGNIYANDALFLARIHPLKKSKSLTNSEIAKLYHSIKKIIEQAIKNKGSSGADEAYILPDGTKGRHQRHFLVYQKEKSPCPNCGYLIKRIKQNNRSSFFCPRCQK